MQIDIPNLLISYIIGLSPFIFVFILYYIIHKLKKDSLFEKVLFRIVLGYAVFIIFYVLIPATINLIDPPENQYLFTTGIIDLNSSSVVTFGYWEAGINSFIRFWLQIFITTVLTYLYYPIALMPIIFIFGGFLSFLLIIYQLKKINPKESLSTSFLDFQYAYDDNPIKLMHEKLKTPDWESAKDLMKILLAVLPISLYLLMTLLKVSGSQENPNILQGTSLGWFLEIFFVYLASMMFSVHLLYSGKFSFKGDYIGLKMKNAMVQSLSTVGALMSGIAIILFVIDYSRQVFVVLYFIFYFIMVTIFFGLFLDIFEPISIYLVTKLVEYLKTYIYVTSKNKTPTTDIEGEKATKKTEIFVPSVNLNELSSPTITPSIENIDTKEDNTLIENETKLSKEKTIEHTQITLNSLLMKDSSILLGKSIFTVLLLYAMLQILGFLISGLGIENTVSSPYVQVIDFVVCYFFVSLGLIISFALFSKRNVKIVIFAVIFHSLLTMLDLAVRQSLIYWNGSTKVSTINYETSYYSLQLYAIIILLAVSLLFLRRYNWNFFSNIGIIFLTGLVMVVTWIFMFTPDMNIIVPFINQPILKSVPITFADKLNSPVPTFNSIVDGLLGRGESWVTYIFENVSIPSIGSLFAAPFLYVVPINFVSILYYLSLPFRFLQPFSTIFLFGLLVFLAEPEFLTVAYKEEDKVEKVVYSERMSPLSLIELVRKPHDFAVARNFGLNGEEEVKAGFSVAQIEEAIYQLSIGAHLTQFISEAPVSFADLEEESLISLEEILNFFHEIEKLSLSKAKPFLVFSKEFGYNYEEANVDSLHVMMVDGRSVFTHNFKEESTVEPALVAGLFSAITSFAKETVKSEQLLRTIDHGDVVLMIEYGKYVFSAIFADKISVDLSNKLASFVEEFEEKHSEVLPDWLGDTSPFADDWILVNQIFELN